MRDYYRKKVREQVKIRSGKLDKKFKKWSLYDQLDFLKPYLRLVDTGTTMMPENYHNDSRIDTEVDSEEEGIHFEMGLVKAGNSDVDEDNKSDNDNYLKDVVQAKDSGYGLRRLKKPGKTPTEGRSNKISTRTCIRQRPDDLDTKEVTTQNSSSKRQRFEWSHSALAKPVKLHHTSLIDVPGEINTNHQFFASLIPMIETLDPLTAMEFRHDVHGLLLRYLKQEKDIKAQSSKSTTTSDEVIAKTNYNANDQDITSEDVNAEDNHIVVVMHNGAC
ncbi:hypothetical protein ElyMa_002375300 [Elysia marginata]|uniref:BESS domain-containing protein n=1 Tax=Elysia marginata TaxID=1093978 RepID=A0AAV4GBW2_9GAST|nr:hypothetical protein ElyMa_002375300 [Elysia marginata]